jgi:hypothetical protein
VVVQLEGDVLGFANLAAGVGDLVLWLLVLELEEAAADCFCQSPISLTKLHMSFPLLHPRG